MAQPVMYQMDLSGIRALALSPNMQKASLMAAEDGKRAAQYSAVNVGVSFRVQAADVRGGFDNSFRKGAAVVADADHAQAKMRDGVSALHTAIPAIER